MDFLHIPKQQYTGKLNAGTLLIAEPFLLDEGFSRSVVCICEHGEDGTIGFVINKFANLILGDLLHYENGLRTNIYTGGPVQQDTLHMLHRLPSLLGGVQIADGVYWGGSFDTLKVLLEKAAINDADVKLFLGYSGWSVGQLDGEMAQGSWLLGQVCESFIFDTDIHSLWSNAIRSLGNEYAHLVNMPVNPQYN